MPSLTSAIEKLIKNKKVVNKPILQGMLSCFPISIDQTNENEVTEKETVSSCISISSPSNISIYKTF